MAYVGQISRRQRALSFSGAIIVVTATGLLLLGGLHSDMIRSTSATISALAIPLPPPPREIASPSPAIREQASGKASTPGKIAEAAAIVAPKSPLPPPTPPISAALRPDTGAAPAAGATPDPGPGTGAGGRGDGTGVGGTASGTGGGAKAQWRSGAIRDSDYPRDARRARTGGEVEVRFTIEANGRVTGCHVTRSSGDASLDHTTCTLIETRFRFKPATDASGRPIASLYGWRQNWWLE